jgi:hypothetical protein
MIKCPFTPAATLGQFPKDPAGRFLGRRRYERNSKFKMQIHKAWNGRTASNAGLERGAFVRRALRMLNSQLERAAGMAVHSFHFYRCDAEEQRYRRRLLLQFGSGGPSCGLQRRSFASGRCFYAAEASRSCQRVRVVEAYLLLSTSSHSGKETLPDPLLASLHPQ